MGPPFAHLPGSALAWHHLNVTDAGATEPLITAVSADPTTGTPSMRTPSKVGVCAPVGDEIDSAAARARSPVTRRYRTLLTISTANTSVGGASVNPVQGTEGLIPDIPATDLDLRLVGGYGAAGLAREDESPRAQVVRQ